MRPYDAPRVHADAGRTSQNGFGPHHDQLWPLNIPVRESSEMKTRVIASV